jgi:hypothetical protein
VTGRRCRPDFGVILAQEAHAEREAKLADPGADAAAEPRRHLSWRQAGRTRSGHPSEAMLRTTDVYPVRDAARRAIEGLGELPTPC